MLSVGIFHHSEEITRSVGRTAPMPGPTDFIHYIINKCIETKYLTVFDEPESIDEEVRLDNCYQLAYSITVSVRKSHALWVGQHQCQVGLTSYTRLSIIALNQST